MDLEAPPVGRLRRSLSAVWRRAPGAETAGRVNKPLVVAVTRVTYKDGTHEYFTKTLRLRVVADQLEFSDGRRIYGRHMQDVDHVDDIELVYGLSEEEAA